MTCQGNAREEDPAKHQKMQYMSRSRGLRPLYAQTRSVPSQSPLVSECDGETEKNERVRKRKTYQQHSPDGCSNLSGENQEKRLDGNARGA